ncbi:hypothetical protein ACFE04_022934 [Oxalis oulophora]
MSDHLVLIVDRLPEASSSSSSVAAVYDGDEAAEEEPLIAMVAECRICQEEDSVKSLETPCGCSGSLKYAHRKCVQHWCNEKGDIICEICHKPYQHGYTAPPRPPPPPEETAIDIGGGWTISGTPLDLRDPRLLAIAEAERHFLEAEYDEYAASNASGAAFCRSAALILMALLLLRHALIITDGDNGDDDVSTFFSLFLLRAAGFLLPCYIMAWAISILQRRRQRQEAAALAATQVAFVLQSGQRRGLHFTIAPGPDIATSHQEISPLTPSETKQNKAQDELEWETQLNSSHEEDEFTSVIFYMLCGSSPSAAFRMVRPLSIYFIYVPRYCIDIRGKRVNFNSRVREIVEIPHEADSKMDISIHMQVSLDHSSSQTIEQAINITLAIAIAIAYRRRK